jgi:predicted nucleic acid-binding protein
MDLVIDANILFAAFMKNGTTRRVLLDKTPAPLKLYTTPFILEETYKYRKLLAEKASLDENDIVGLVLELLASSNTEIVKGELLSRYMGEAERLSPRNNDTPASRALIFRG